MSASDPDRGVQVFISNGVIQGDFVDTSDYIMRRDNTAAFTKTAPISHDESINEESQPTSQARMGVHYVYQIASDVNLSWRRSTLYAFLSGFLSAEVAEAAAEAFSTGKWAIPTIRGGHFPRAELFHDNSCTVYLMDLPVTTTKDDILSSMPLNGQRPTEIHIGQKEQRDHTKTLAIISAMCGQAGTMLSFKHDPHRSVWQNFYKKLLRFCSIRREWRPKSKSVAKLYAATIW